MSIVGTGPPVGSSWTFARPTELVQCCWCGEAILPGDNAMVVVQDADTRWWSHYEERPCYGTRPSTTPTDSEVADT